MAKELPQQQTVFAKVLQDGLNVREAEGLVQKMAVWKPQKKTVQILAEFRPLEEKIKNGHARAIMMAKELPQQQTVFAKVLQDGLNVREAEGLVQKMAVWKPQKKTVQILAEFRPLEEKIKNVLGIQTLKLKMEAGRPKLVIMFSSKKEIENLLKKLNL
ncbi:MAG: hypothetical protein A2667_03270 [Candidatus Wildermuthbacteria bacterium RIFCSPHIGHO2_01_FULL_47_27]|nr:MAG: hypothetical protein A2667_03270 [Candidatus Wildermuthbacteria bacterium RIFCSPHIGHO2_01_FULL_47_27]